MGRSFTRAVWMTWFIRGRLRCWTSSSLEFPGRGHSCEMRKPCQTANGSSCANARSAMHWSRGRRARQAQHSMVCSGARRVQSMAIDIRTFWMDLISSGTRQQLTRCLIKAPIILSREARCQCKLSRVRMIGMI